MKRLLFKNFLNAFDFGLILLIYFGGWLDDPSLPLVFKLVAIAGLVVLATFSNEMSRDVE